MIGIRKRTKDRWSFLVFRVYMYKCLVCNSTRSKGKKGGAGHFSGKSRFRVGYMGP